MAQIDSARFERVDKKRCNVHDKVQSTFTVFEIEDKKYVQIDMYGKDTRETDKGSSQIIQFDKTSAKIIADLLCKEFKIT